MGISDFRANTANTANAANTANTNQGGGGDGSRLTRREFVRLTMGAIAMAGMRTAAVSDQMVGGMPYRTLGRTGEKVSLVGLGGYHIGVQEDENESVLIIRTAIDNGINFLDNSWDYNGGASEIRTGKALRDGYRSKVFLMSKIDGRTASSAQKQIEESLRRLQTDYIDLMQLHEIIRIEDADRVFAERGAMETLLAAQQAGKIRYIGFTGHKSPEIHLNMLNKAAENGVRFDSVQMPLNVMDAHYSSFERNVLPLLVQEQIGVLGMKSLGDAIILESKSVTPMECFHYAMSLPTSVVITGCDSLPILHQALDAARRFRPLTSSQVASILARTAPFAAEGRFERYKSTRQFDSTYSNPEWLG